MALKQNNINQSLVEILSQDFNSFIKKFKNHWCFLYWQYIILFFLLVFYIDFSNTIINQINNYHFLLFYSIIAAFRALILSLIDFNYSWTLSNTTNSSNSLFFLRFFSLKPNFFISLKSLILSKWCLHFLHAYPKWLVSVQLQLLLNHILVFPLFYLSDFHIRFLFIRFLISLLLLVYIPLKTLLL